MKSILYEFCSLFLFRLILNYAYMVHIRDLLFMFVVKLDNMKLDLGQIRSYRRLDNDSEYKYIQKIYNMNNRDTFYITNMKCLQCTAHTTAKEAALVIDKYLISKGKEPVNILVKK